MLQIPRWLVFLVAAWVIVFGIFRIYVAIQRGKPEDPERPNFRRKGLYAQSPKRHIVFGVLYVALGGVLIAMGLGYNIPMLGQGCSGNANQAEPATGRSIEISPQ